MGIEGLNGVSAMSSMNTSSGSKTTRSQNTDIQVESVAAKVQPKIENITVNSAKNNQSDTQGNANGEDRGALQGGQNVSKEKIMSAVDDLNKQVKNNPNVHRTQLSFKYHDETNRISITVKDSDTDEVIREIPPEKALDMLAKAWEMAGLLVDEKR